MSGDIFSLIPRTHIPNTSIFITQSAKSRLLQKVQSKLTQDGRLESSTVTLQFLTDYAPGEEQVTDSLLPVVTGRSSGRDVLQFFRDDIYFSNLSTSVLGNVVMVTDVVPTTMPLFDK